MRAGQSLAAFKVEEPVTKVGLRDGGLESGLRSAIFAGVIRLHPSAGSANLAKKV